MHCKLQLPWLYGRWLLCSVLQVEISHPDIGSHMFCSRRSKERASKNIFINLSSDDNILSLLIKKNVLYMSFSTSLQGSKWAITMRPHCIKSVRIRSYSGPHFPTFGLDRDKCSVSLRIQSECRKMRTRITPNTDTFHAVPLSIESTLLLFLLI